ncbi:MAG: LEA type 2 family protein [Chitinophagaceae bacterium]|nr:LEA type 2 family protein [Chitinophagaceae bacterium]
MKNRFLYLFLCLALWLSYSSCTSVKEPELIGIENVTIERLGVKESALNVELHYHNPNSFRVKLKRAEGTAWLDDNPLGDFVLDTLLHIRANSDFRLPLKLKMDMRHFVSNMAKFVSGKQVAIKVEGTARVSKGILTGNYPIKYEGKEKLGELLK